MQDQNVGCLVWSPLAGGYMAGKYTPGGDAQDAGRRAAFDFPPIDKEKADRIVLAMRPIAKAHGVSVARVALAWVRQKPFVTSTIIGAKTMAQLNDNLEAVTLELTAAEMAALDEISADRPQYPHWMAKRNNSTRHYAGEPVKIGGIPSPKV
jgi:aryl-alcohol dehydrogenase-like predicted oxidoreductase